MFFKKIYTLLFLLCFPVFSGKLCYSKAKQEFVVAEGGKSQVYIKVSSSASFQDKHAADELALFLEKITGTAFKIKERYDKSNPSILVGVKAVKEAGKDISTEALGDEGIVIKLSGKDLILAGAGKRGTLYAVYTFLEDIAGCHWWTKTESYIPSKLTFKISDLDLRYKPVLDYRNSFWIQCFDPDWAVRNKCNDAGFFDLDEKRGDGELYSGFVHTFYKLIPPEKFFERHPEWFALVDGKRRSENAQLCLTDMKMADKMVKRLKNRLSANKNYTIASVSQNDGAGACECKECQRINKLEGSPSGTLLRFVNYVAKHIEKDFPDVKIDTLAYQYTQEPPAITKPRHNVIVRLCPIEADFSVPLTHERNSSFYNDLKGWSEIAHSLYIWTYSTNFSHYPQPFPNFHVLGKNIKTFVDNHVKGVMVQGAYKSEGAWLSEMKGWVTAKLLWNPLLNVKHLCRTFAKGYYGDGGSYVINYMGILEKSLNENPFYDEEPKAGMNLRTPPTADFLSYKVLCKCWKELKKCERAVKGKEVFEERIRLLQANTLYPVLVRWEELRDHSKKNDAEWPFRWNKLKDAYEWWKQVTKKAGVTKMNEWNNIENMELLLDDSYEIWDFVGNSPEK